MSITDELRNWMENAFTYKTVDGDMFHKVNTPWFGWKRDIEEMLDRIDAEHEKATAGCIHYDPERHYCAVHGDTEHGRVRLPVDADGVPIHVGDRLTDSAEYKSEGVVKRLMIEPTGWSVNFDAGWSDERFHDWHHYTPPTVEDVLEEFAQMYIACNDKGTIAEYAKRLRLRGEGE